MELCGLVWTRYTPQNTLYIALFQLHLLVDPVFECGGLHLRDTNKGSMMRRAVATLTRRVYYSPAGYEGSFRGTAVVDFLERSPFSTAAASRRGTRGDLVDVLGHRNEQGQLAPQVSKQDLEQRSSMSVFNATELAYGMYHIHDAGVGSSARPLLHGIADEAVTRLHQFQADDLAQMTYCLHAANVRHNQWYRQIAKELPGRVDQLLASEIASTVLILAREGIHDSNFLNAVASRTSSAIGKTFQRQMEFTGRQLSMVAESFELLKEKNEGLAAAMVTTVERFPAMFTPKDLKPVLNFIASSGQGNANFHKIVNNHETIYEEATHWQTRRNEDHDPTNIIYSMHVPDAYGAPHRLRPRKFVLGEGQASK